MNPVWLGKLDAGGTTVNCVEVTDGYLYTTYYIDGNYTSIQVYDIDPPENAHLVGMADAYPWQSITLDYQDGYLYTFAGTVTDPKQFGFCVFDVTSPENPQYIETRIVDNVDMYRELRIKDGIAYALTGDVLGVLCIYDLFSQDTAQLIGYVELVYSYFFDDMVLNDYYAFLHSSDSSSLYIVDIEPPEEAHLVKTIDEEFCGLFEIRDDLLFSSDDWNLNIYDIDPVSDTHLVQTMPLPVGSVNVTLDGQYAYLPVNHSNCMYIADIDPIESAHIINTVFGVARNAHMILVDDINYLLGSNMLQILDISTPSQSELITSLILHNGIRDMDYENGYVYIASLDEGLLVVDVEPLEATHLVTTLPLGSNTRIVGVNNSTACVISSQDLWIVDVGIPDSPDLIDVFDLAENGIQLEVQGNYAFVLESGGYMDYTMSVIDISDPYNAALKNTVTIPAKDICAFLIEGSRIYIGDDASPNFIHVVDISNPESAFLAASLQSSDTPEFFDVHGDLLFKAGDSPGLVVLDVGLLDDIQLVFSDPSVESDRIVVDDNRMFLSGYTLRIYEWY